MLSSAVNYKSTIGFAVRAGAIPSGLIRVMQPDIHYVLCLVIGGSLFPLRSLIDGTQQGVFFVALMRHNCRRVNSFL